MIQRDFTGAHSVIGSHKNESPNAYIDPAAVIAKNWSSLIAA